MVANLQFNSLYYGDCLEVMREWPPEVFDLVYLDPPFNSKANYNVLFGQDNEEIQGGSNPAQMIAFEDTWRWDENAVERVSAIERAAANPAHNVIRGIKTAIGECGMLAYLSYMAERLVEIRRVLKSTGSVYLHCDPTASHYLKAIMDGIFGIKNYQNEITWKRYAVHSLEKDTFDRVSDVILVYSRDHDQVKFKPIYAAQEEGFIDKKFPYVEPETGRRFQHVALEQNSNKTGERLIQGKKITSTVGWRWTQETFDERLKENPYLIHWTKGGRPRYKLYADEYEGMPLGNIWTDIKYLASGSKERTGYPTQKPLALLERIIEASTTKDDAVLDPFCGCGTTMKAADRMRRRWVGIDVSPFAVHMVRGSRLKDKSIPINGIPADMESARTMAQEKPFDFEKWALSCLPGIAPNDKQVGDGGVDGRGHIYQEAGGGGLVLAQVKGGSFSLYQLRDFLHVVNRENAAMGVFVTLDKVSSSGARAAASKAGTFRLGAKDYPKVQLWSIQDHFDGREPDIPPLADPYTGQPAQKDLFAP